MAASDQFPVIDNQACEKKLRNGIEVMGISLSDDKIRLLMIYLEEFTKWNKAYNLSAVRNPIEMVERHLLDSLVLVPFLQKHNADSDKKQYILDVGTGGGLPGIPLSIVFPEVNFVLLDSNGKKTRFLFHIKTVLKLGNVSVENTRVEQYNIQQKFTIVVSRAFASLQDMVLGTQHLLEDDGRFWAMKGVYPENELRDCEKHAMVDFFSELKIPHLEGERHLLVLKSNR